jgi:hypothetical protein
MEKTLKELKFIFESREKEEGKTPTVVFLK